VEPPAGLRAGCIPPIAGEGLKPGAVSGGFLVLVDEPREFLAKSKNEILVRSVLRSAIAGAGWTVRKLRPGEAMSRSAGDS
jgi:hypothetical protein